MGGKLGKKKGFTVIDKSKEQKTEGAATELEDTAKENGEPTAVAPEPKVVKNDKGPQIPAEDFAREGDSAISQGDVIENESTVSMDAKAELPESHDAAGIEAPEASEPRNEAEVFQPLTPTTKENAEKTSPTVPDN